MAGQLFYASGAVTTTLAASLSSGGTSVQVASIAGYPAQYPFTLLLEWGSGSQEVVTVTQAATGTGPYTFANCLRGQDGTTGVSHSSGAAVSHGVSARDFFQAAPVFNVCAYGADPTGTADSATGIQAALTAARTSASGGVVFVPPGTYITGQILQIGSNTTLAGAGMGVTTIKAKSGMTPTQIGSLAGITVLQVYNEAAASNITVRDLTIDGNEAGNTTISSPFSSGFSAAVRLDQVDKLRITGVEVINAILYSIWLNACTRFEVDNCTILSGQDNTLGYNDQDGVHVTNSQYGRIRGCNIDTGTYYSPTVGDDAICLQSLATAGGGGAATGGGGPGPTSDVSVTGNVIRSATRGVAVLLGGSAGSNITIAGNTVWTAGAPWVILAWDIATTNPTKNVTITGNTFLAGNAGNGGYGIHLMPGGSAGVSQGWADVNISGNTFSGLIAPPGNPGIFCSYGSGLVISGNIFDGWLGNIGIQVGDTAGPGSMPVTGFSVTGNVLNMSGSTETSPIGILLLNSSAGSVSGNTIVGGGQSGSVGLMLKGLDVATSGIAVTGNRITAWATGIAESNAGAQPDYCSYVGNNVHACTAFISTSGSHDVVASNVVA